MSAAPRRLLVIDSSYSFQAIRERQLEAAIVCRDLDGYFEHVWSVHPFASLVTSAAWGPAFGPPTTYEVATRHTFIEGKVGRVASLGTSALNFVIAQADLFVRLLYLARRQRISVIRAGDPLYCGLVGWALSRVAGVPLVVRVGGNNDKVYATTGRPLMPRLFRSRAMEKRVERFVLRRADLVAGANQDNLNFALANGASPGRATLFRYGNLVHDGHFAEPSEREGGRALLDAAGAAGKRVLLYVGRLEPVKRVDDVIRALSIIRKDRPDVAAVLVGDGSQRASLERLALELGVAADVVFCGNRDQDWLSRVIPGASVVLSPHTGRALTETALGAAAIVAYDIDGQPEIVTTGLTGELVPNADVDAMARSAARLLDDPALARRYGANVRRRVLEMMDPARLNAHERECYTRLMEYPAGP